jgi:hypothetical protein
VLVYAPVDGSARDVTAALGVGTLAIAVGLFMSGLMSGPDGELPTGLQLALGGMTLTLIGAGLLGWSTNAQARTAYLVGGGLGLVLGVGMLAVGLTRKGVRT